MRNRFPSVTKSIIIKYEEIGTKGLSLIRNSVLLPISDM